MNGEWPQVQFHPDTQRYWKYRWLAGLVLGIALLPLFVIVFALMGALDRGVWIVFGGFILLLTLFGAIGSIFMQRPGSETGLYTLELTENAIKWHGALVRIIPYDEIQQVLVRYKGDKPQHIGVVGIDETISIRGYAEMALILQELGQRVPKRVPINHATSIQVTQAMRTRPSKSLREQIRQQRASRPAQPLTPYPLGFVLPSFTTGIVASILLAAFTGYPWTDYYTPAQIIALAIALIVGSMGRLANKQKQPTAKQLWIGRFIGLLLLGGIVLGSYRHLNYALFSSPCRPVMRWTGQSACARLLNGVEAEFAGASTQMTYVKFNNFYLADFKQWPLVPAMNRQRIPYDYDRELTISADGRYALVDEDSYNQSAIHLIRTDTLETVWTQDDLDILRPTQLSYNGAYLAYSASDSRHIEVWDAQTREVQFTIPSIAGAFADAQNWLAYFAADSSSIAIVDVEDQSQIASIQSMPFSVSITDDLSFANNDTWLMIDSDDGLAVIDIATDTIVGEWAPVTYHSSYYTQHAISPDGSHLILEDNTQRDGHGLHFLAIWNIVNHQLIATIEFPQDRPEALSFSADSRYLAASYYNDTMVFDLHRLDAIPKTSSE